MKAVIFDMDGVILDSELHWKKAELTLFSKMIGNWTKEDQQKIIGLNVNDTYRVLANEYRLAITHKEYLRRVKGVAQVVYKNKANLLDGFLKKIKDIKDRGMPIALASSSLREWIEIVLNRFDLNQYFDVVVSAEDIDAPGKPAPDIYLHTAKHLNLEPKDCAVIEDSKHGVEAAKSAGMFCVGLRNGFNQAQDLSSADIEVNGFKNLDLKRII